MPDPYNPWATPIFPGASAFGVGSPAETAERQPTIVDNLLSHIAGALGRGFMAPGNALNSPTPLTSEQMIAPAMDMAGMLTLGSGAMPAEADALNMGIRGFHGSPRADLTSISASPGSRQFDNATSQLGAFFAPKAEGAERYAGKTGKIYSADVPIEKPYEMPWREFDYLQSPHKAADGSILPGEHWGARADELKQEAAQIRQKLIEQGHDGVVVRKSNGDIYEMASFGDVPVVK